MLIFDDLTEAEEERYRNMRAGVLLSEAFNPHNRAMLQELFSEDPETLRQSLDQFDRLRHQLRSVEAGRHRPRYLVPDFDCAKTSTWLYVPSHDPRYKSALAGGHVDDDTPVIYPARTDGP